MVDLSYHTKTKTKGGHPMDNIIQLNAEAIKSQLGDLVRNTIEKTLNDLLDKEADRFPTLHDTNVTKHEKIHVLDIINANYLPKLVKWI